MNIWGYILMAIVIISALITVVKLIFQYLIKKNIVKPSKISRIFYRDDESFINYWRKTQQEGILKYTVKNVIINTIAIGLLGAVIVLYNPQRGSLLWYTVTGAIAGLLQTPMLWSDNKNRYSLIEEKSMENTNVSKGNKKIKA